jgi:hypothetical protein
LRRASLHGTALTIACLGSYLLVAHALTVIGVATIISMVAGRDDDVVTAGITSCVVLVVAALSRHNRWEQPPLRLADTAVGIAIG